MIQKIMLYHSIFHSPFKKNSKFQSFIFKSPSRFFSTADRSNWRAKGARDFIKFHTRIYRIQIHDSAVNALPSRRRGGGWGWTRSMARGSVQKWGNAITDFSRGGLAAIRGAGPAKTDYFNLKQQTPWFLYTIIHAANLTYACILIIEASRVWIKKKEEWRRVDRDENQTDPSTVTILFNFPISFFLLVSLRLL